MYHKKEVSCCSDDHCFTPLLGRYWACCMEGFLSHPPLPSGLVSSTYVNCAATVLLSERGIPLVFGRAEDEECTPEAIARASAEYEEMYEQMMLQRAEVLAAGFKLEVYERRIVRELREYKEIVAGRAIVLEQADLQTGNVRNIILSGATNSRYFAAGRSRIKRYLAKRIPNDSKHGVLMTFTVDPSRYSKEQAYRQIWQEFADFRDRMRKWRKRRGWRASLGYVAVIEQHKSGYPHLHVAYPGLRYLAPIEMLDRWWKMGMNRVDGGVVSPLSYVCKYVSKLTGWSEIGMAYLRSCKTRLYNISQSLYRPKEDPEVSMWVFVGSRRGVEWTGIAVIDTGLRIGAHFFADVFEGLIGLPEGRWYAFGTVF